jgi:hypothetical protein
MSSRSSIISRKAKRLGLLTISCMAALTVAVPAVAAPSSSYIGRAFGAAQDLARTHANRAHPDQFKDTFAIHQLGAVVGARVDNRAIAASAGCKPDDPCRSVALSFQIVTMAGSNVRLSASNIGRAVNYECPGCQTLAVAYQFIVSTPRPFTLSDTAKGQLEAIEDQLDALRDSQEPIALIHKCADSLADEVKAILNREAAAAPRGPVVHPLDTFQPTVTMHSHFDQQD